MGCIHSILSNSYDDSGEVWQAQAKWHNQHPGLARLDSATERNARQYQEPSPVHRQEPAYQPKARSPAAVASPQKAARAFVHEPQVEDDLDSSTDPAELEDEFPVERGLQQPPPNWSRGELIGSGAFGRVYLGLNNDSGELMAVKQVSVSKQENVAGRVAHHVRGLEKEVNLLKQLNHPNIVRYLVSLHWYKSSNIKLVDEAGVKRNDSSSGIADEVPSLDYPIFVTAYPALLYPGTDRSKDCLNIFLEYVPGGSIASLLSKFGSFKETVIKLYARQILLGLQYLHVNKIMHRDIKGANILVDNTGLVKLADFGASKEIEDLVTIDSGSKSIKGTSYWMAPEVIKQTGHDTMADIWSVGCTIIEMATGKPPWSQFSSQVSAMFHIASAKGPPPIPDHLSADAKDFLLLCLKRTPQDRPTAPKLLQHPFLADVSNVKTAHAAPLANLANGPSRGHSPSMEEAEKPTRRPKVSTQQTHLNAGSAEFMKLYSPMADRMAEAAARSRPASTAGEGRERGGWQKEGGQDMVSPLDSHLRQSMASHASTRYDGPAAGELLDSPQASSASDSDYNPVEEPTWLQHDSLQATHFSYMPSSSPSDTPRIRAYGVAESTAVASPMRVAKQNLHRQGGQKADDSMEEIMSFVRDKAQKDMFRLSVPFSMQAVAKAQGATQYQGNKQRQWEAELEEELERERSQIRSGKAV